MFFLRFLVATLAAVSLVPGMPQGADQAFAPLQLNIRLSPTALRPPSHLIKQQWTLDGYRLGRLGPQAPQAVIIEDDARRRLLILSATDERQVLVYQVGDLPVDVAARLRPALVCGRTREGQKQRMAPAGARGRLG